VHTPWTSDYLDRIELEKGKITVTKENLCKAVELILENIQIKA
jgi:hypothetical protein